MDNLFDAAIQEFTQKLAYEHWVRRGRPFGSPEVDWYAAEKFVADPHAPLRDGIPLYGLAPEPVGSSG